MGNNGIYVNGGSKVKIWYKNCNKNWHVIFEFNHLPNNEKVSNCNETWKVMRQYTTNEEYVMVAMIYTLSRKLYNVNCEGTWNSEGLPSWEIQRNG